MKAIFNALGHPFSRRFFVVAAAAAVLVSTTSCYTTYDAYGRPVQSVDPAMAIAGVAAAGLIGYAIADNKSDNHYYGGGHRGYNRGYASHGYAPSYGHGYGHGGRHGRSYCRY